LVYCSLSYMEINKPTAFGLFAIKLVVIEAAKVRGPWLNLERRLRNFMLTFVGVVLVK